MAAEQAMLLPVTYFHVVFTLPHALNALLRANRRCLYARLFRTAARTLRICARDPRHLGAEPAVTMVLHTWGQTLTEHPHVHCVVSGGGLSLDGRSWISVPKGKKKRRRPFLFHVGALSQVFRGQFIAALQRARRRGALRYLGQSAALAEPGPWEHLIAQLWKQDWVVYAKPPFGGPETVLKYLSRYTHRVAISNRRILSVGDGLVRFSYRDYTDRHRSKEMTLAATDFLPACRSLGAGRRRFLLHVLPPGFKRILMIRSPRVAKRIEGHYGITANCRRKNKLACCRELLGQAQRPLASDANAGAGTSCHDDPGPPEPKAARCPNCGARMSVIEILSLTTAPYDTS